MIGLLAMAAASAASCQPVTGAERLWAKPDTRWVMVGEMHGTAEMPAVFADLVCQARSSGRPITVALEQDVEMQPAIDIFLASDGGPGARKTFLGAPMWAGRDGRASQAMLALYERLRVMRQAGHIRAVLAFIPPFHGWKGDGPYNAEMADTLKAMPVASGGLILAYMGNLHAARSRVGQGANAFLPAAADLPPERTISVDIQSNGGEAWNCRQDVCAPHPVQARDAKRGFASAEGLPYDWVFETGTRSTASPPAVQSR